MPTILRIDIGEMSDLRVIEQTQVNALAVNPKCCLPFIVTRIPYNAVIARCWPSALGGVLPCGDLLEIREFIVLDVPVNMVNDKVRVATSIERTPHHAVKAFSSADSSLVKMNLNITA